MDRTNEIKAEAVVENLKIDGACDWSWAKITHLPFYKKDEKPRTDCQMCI